MINVSAWAIRRPLAALVIFFGLCGGGLWGLWGLAGGGVRGAS